MKEGEVIMRTSHKLMLSTCILMSSASYAQNLIRENVNLPTWTEGTEVQVGYLYESIDIDGSSNLDNHGIGIEVNKDFALNNGFITTSAVSFKTTESAQDFSEVDNTAVGLTQRITKGYEMNQMVIYPIVGIGASYGQLEFGEYDSMERDYLSANIEGTLKLDTLRGVAPYLTYSYQMANLEDTERDMKIHSLSTGVSFVF